ncbi:MAG: hypothetical protein IH596_02690 [Bacteroidales bacterium]|nr:hypothetical protein [Bacteroidales bacterium]
MKKITIILLLLAVSTIAIPQENTRKSRTFNYFNRTEAGVSFGVGNFKTNVLNGIQYTAKNNEIAVAFQTINGIAYHGRIGIGIGVGVESWRDGLFFPVFGQLHYDLRPRDKTFYGQLSLGSGIGNRYGTTFFQKGTGGLMFQAGIGYKMKVFKRLRFYYEVFYKYQSVNSAYEDKISTSDTTIIRNIEYKVPLNFLGFKIGISFY